MEWISVKDRLPEPWVWVLVYRKMRDVHATYIDIARYDGYDREWGPGRIRRFADRITHWQPLPPRPV
jgi:hypothetical protein